MSRFEFGIAMQKSIGIACLTIGVMLLVWGHNISESLVGVGQRLINGTPPDKAVIFYIAGALLMVAGAVQIYSDRK